MGFEFDYVSYFGNMAFLLGLVVLMAYISLMLKKKGFGKWKLPAALAGLKQGAGEHNLQIIEKMSLEPRKNVYLIQADGQRWLVGTTDVNIQLIGKLDKDKKSKSMDTDVHGQTFKDYIPKESAE